jgi:hypothetical protein
MRLISLLTASSDAPDSSANGIAKGRALANGRWCNWPRQDSRIFFCYGRIGSQVAEYGRTFGMNVVTSFSETVHGAAERGSTDLFVVPNWSPLARPDREDNGTGGGNYIRHIAARRTSAREIAIIP